MKVLKYNFRYYGVIIENISLKQNRDVVYSRKYKLSSVNFKRECKDEV